MCGRYVLENPEEIEKWFGASKSEPQQKARYNIAPGQLVPVVTQDSQSGDRRIELMRWGLQPMWAVRKGSPFTRINARDDTLKEAAFKGRTPGERCLIPSTGFYEWKREGKKKTPYLFQLTGGGLFAFAGICDRSAEVPTFAIVTTAPNAVVAPIHDRMPVMLGKREALWWAEPDREWSEVGKLLRAFPEQQMERHLVRPEGVSDA